jgi:hypothetical protein
VKHVPARVAVPVSQAWRDFLERGWCRFPFDRELSDWIVHALPAARASLHDPELAQWWRCGGTWFAGVHALRNDEEGRVGDGPPLAGAAVDFIRAHIADEVAWDRAQVSVCLPGYPRPGLQESESEARYRRDRDAAHVDGLHASGPEKRRFIRECHAFVLGIPLVEAGPDASPLVVWEGSHELIRTAFRHALEPSNQDGSTVDVTDVYKATRREIFAHCPRVPVHARPGEAYLVHRLALHGVAPWGEGAQAGPDGRMIAYFRPVRGTVEEWLASP